MNYTDILHANNPASNRYANIVLVVGSSWLIALSAQINLNIPFSPVPVTGQTLVVLLCGLILGKNLSVAAVGTYLLQGTAGLPFFAGGKSGLAALLGPTGGYLFGFLAAAYIVGMLSELRHRRSPIQAAITLLLGNIIIYLIGLAWLVRFTGEAQVLQLGFYPFLPGDAMKLLVALAIVSGGSLLANHFQLDQEPH